MKYSEALGTDRNLTVPDAPASNGEEIISFIIYPVVDIDPYTIVFVSSVSSFVVLSK